MGSNFSPLHLHDLFAKSSATFKMSEYVCAAKVINNFGIIIRKR